MLRQITGYGDLVCWLWMTPRSSCYYEMRQSFLEISPNQATDEGCSPHKTSAGSLIADQTVFQVFPAGESCDALETPMFT